MGGFCKFLVLLLVVLAATVCSEASAQQVVIQNVNRGRILQLRPLFAPRQRVVVNNFGAAVAVPTFVQPAFIQPQFVQPQVFVGQSAFGVPSFGFQPTFGVQSFGVRSFRGCTGGF